jgi:hypothetical protein
MARFFNLFQSLRLAEASAEAQNARDHSERTRLELSALRQQVESLTLTCQALCETLRDHVGVPEEVLLARMEEIDLRDGVADGKVAHQPIDCRHCGRRSGPRRRTCLYCGERLFGIGATGG